GKPAVRDVSDGSTGDGVLLEPPGKILPDFCAEFVWCRLHGQEPCGRTNDYPKSESNGQEFEKVLHGFLVKTGDGRTNRRPFCASNPKHFEKGGKNGSTFFPFPGVQE
ncbi:MAG: hypothetical protein WBG23_18715, partial [Acidobacteriaceae bacterium]